MRFGIRGRCRRPSARRLGLVFHRAPVGGSFLADVLPGMLLLGIGAGMAFNPVMLAAMSDVDERGGACLGRRQHLLHDGRRARPGGLASLAAAQVDGGRAGGAPSRA